MTPETFEKMQAIYRKYHLTMRQAMQVQWIILSVVQGKKVLYVAPRKAGQTTVYRASKEIIELLNFDIKKLKTHDTR